MSSFSSLYADAQLCVLRFLALPDLAVMLRVCKSLASVAAQVALPPMLRLKARASSASPSGFAPPLLPHPQSVRRLVTELHCCIQCCPQLLSDCAPFALRQRCPALMSLQLHFYSVEACEIQHALSLLPALPLFWPSSLMSLVLLWSDVYSAGKIHTLGDMADQLRALCRVAGGIPSLTSLSLDATSDLGQNIAVFQDGAPFLPILVPLLPLTRLERLEISIGDYCHGDTHSRWVCDEDCSVICQLPSLVFLSVNDGKWSREGLLEHLTHSNEAAAFRVRVACLDMQEDALDADTMEAFRQLQRACPRIAVNLD